jgi:membrane protease subunit HflK
LTNPDESLKQVSESALRAVVGQSSLNEILTTGRAEITNKIRHQVQAVLDSYKSGLQISDLAMQQTKPPAAVQDAFDDAIKAQQDEERYVNQAQAYARKHIPIAEGNATRILEEAKAYKDQVILLARGETARFAKLLPEYKLNPQVLRDRLYLDTMREVYSNTPKVVMNAQGSNVNYLPLDKILQPGRTRVAKTAEPEGAAHKTAAPSSATETKKAAPGRLTYEDIDRIKYTRNNGGA